MMRFRLWKQSSKLHGRYRHLLQPFHVFPMQASILMFLEQPPQCKLIEVAYALC